MFFFTREWRQSGGVQRYAAQVVHDTLPSPSASASIKRHKPNQPIPSQPFASSSPPQADPTHQFASWTAKRGLVPNVKDKKHKPVSYKVIKLVSCVWILLMIFSPILLGFTWFVFLKTHPLPSSGSTSTRTSHEQQITICSYQFK